MLRHQAVFVAQLTELGMVDETEQEKLMSPIERRMWCVRIRLHATCARARVCVQFSLGSADRCVLLVGV